MSRLRLIIVSAFAVVAICGIASASASAAKRHFRDCNKVLAGFGGYTTNRCNVAAVNGGEWARTYLLGPNKVHACLFVGFLNGLWQDANCTILGGNKEYERVTANIFPAAAGENFLLKGKLAGASAEIKCGKEKTLKPVVETGEEGLGVSVGSAEALEFTSCTSVKPEKCEVNSPGKAAGSISTKAVKTELVEDPTGAKIEMLFSPKEGETFVEVEYKNKGTETCALKGNTFPIKGSSLAEVTPKEEEVEALTLKSEPASKKYKNSKAEEKEAKLTLGTEPATLTGSAKLTQEIEKTIFKEKEVIKTEKDFIGVE